jgi:hypothetical protein
MGIVKCEKQTTTTITKNKIYFHSIAKKNKNVLLFHRPTQLIRCIVSNFSSLKFFCVENDVDVSVVFYCICNPGKFNSKNSHLSFYVFLYAHFLLHNFICNQKYGTNGKRRKFLCSLQNE